MTISGSEPFYHWTNEAGVSWDLHRIQDTNTFDVGANCPYRRNNYTVAEAEVNTDGAVVKIKGPGGEMYDATQ